MNARLDGGADARPRFAPQHAWRERNKGKRSAHIIAQCARRKGLLERQPCEVCGDPKTDGHHEDYSAPLMVRWLCRKHHKARHQEMRCERT